jgi:hypothetical protein
MTTDICDAILPRYADAVDVGSNDDGDCTSAINGGNIDGWVANFDNGKWCTFGGSAMTAGRGRQHWKRHWGLAGGGDILNPTLLSGAGKKDANDNNEYTVVNKGVDKLIAEGNNNDKVPIVTTNNDKPLTNDINNEYAKGDEDNEYTKVEDNYKYAIGNDGVDESLAKGKDNYDMPIPSANNDKSLANDVNNKNAKGNEADEYTKGKDKDKYARGNKNSGHTEGSDNNEYAEGDNDDEPLKDENNKHKMHIICLFFTSHIMLRKPHKDTLIHGIST